MKRFLHALAALWPERRGEGSPPVPDTRTGILQHWAAVLRMDRILSECADSRICKSANNDLGAAAPGEFVRSDGGLKLSKRQQSKFANTQIRESAIKPLLTIVIPVIFMCLMAAKQVSAQAEPAAAAAIKPLQIGDTIPEELWHMPLQVVNHPEGKETITLNDYRGKLIILDFWGTFCGSCITAMPKMKEVQQQFSDDMVIVPISWSKPDATELVLLNHRTLAPLALHSVVDAKPLIDIFPHGVVPHYAWINPQGEIVATTATNDVTRDNIAKVLEGEEPDYDPKIFIDTDKPLLLETKAISTDGIRQYAILINGLLPGIGGGMKFRKVGDKVVGILIPNKSLANIYRVLAWNIKGENPRNSFVMADSCASEIKNTVDFIVPSDEADSLYHHLLKYLNTYSGYTGGWLRKEQNCLTLIRLDGSTRFMSAGGIQDVKMSDSAFRVENCPIELLVRRLNRADVSNGAQVLDETGYDGDVSVKLLAPFTDLEHVRRQLRKQGLDLIPTVREVDIFELRKSSTYYPTIH